MREMALPCMVIAKMQIYFCSRSENIGFPNTPVRAATRNVSLAALISCAYVCKYVSFCVCVQEVFSVQPGPQGWAVSLTNSPLCLSDQTAGSSPPCQSPHQYKLQGQLFTGRLLSFPRLSSPLVSSPLLSSPLEPPSSLIIEPSESEVFQMKTDTYIIVSLTVMSSPHSGLTQIYCLSLFICLPLSFFISSKGLSLAITSSYNKASVLSKKSAVVFLHLSLAVLHLFYGLSEQQLIYALVTN